MLEKIAIIAWDFWAGIIGAALFVFQRETNRPIQFRLMMVASSAMLGFSLVDDLHNWVGISYNITGVIIVLFSYTLIDLIQALIQDREWIKGILRDKLK